MAEFKDVMRQLKRMCSQAAGCSACSLKNKCLTTEFPCRCDENYYAEIERIVMDWAAKNPEPRYPTWVEWWKANFPNALHSICPNYFMREKPLGTCAASCAKCISTPIPADIAEKLGVKPIGGEEDA